MTHEEFEAWKNGFDEGKQEKKIAEARQEFLKDFELSEDEALEIMSVFERKGKYSLEDADGQWYCYYWNTIDKLALEDHVDELEDEIYKKNETLFRLKANFLEVLNNIYHSGSIEEVRDFIDKTLDID